MAQSTMISVGTNFNLSLFAQQLSETYQQKGFNVQVADMGNSVSIVFDKGTGGINMLLGLGLGITANCVVNNGTLTINYTDGDWTGKIIGIVVGWFLCMVPFITSIIGIFKQLGLPKQIGNDAMMIASNMPSNPSLAAGGYYYDSTPAYTTDTTPAYTTDTTPAYTTDTTPAYTADTTPAYTTTSTPSYPTTGAVDSGSGTWNCTCGRTGNTGAFCGNCGSPRPR